jgi:N-ethylmaleimide reductase
LALEIVDAMVAAWSADRIGIRIYPFGAFNGVENSAEDEEVAVLYFIAELAKRQLAYLHISEPDWTGGQPLTEAFRTKIRQAWPGVIIAAGAYTPEKAETLINAGLIDAVAFGRKFIANPDLPQRFKIGAQLNEANPETFYANGEEGYTDYPLLNEPEKKRFIISYGC